MVAILGYSRDQITSAVQAMYAAVARSPTGDFHFPVGAQACRAVGYPDSQLADVPDAALPSFAGVGYPFRADAIREGDAVLDIGAGSGTDTLIAGKMVGDRGHVWALDITPAMLDKLRATIAESGVRNVDVIEGDAEDIPMPDGSVDVVTSNGVLNLVPDKRRAFDEIFRVLRPDGRLQIADIAITRPVVLGGRSDPTLWAQCVVGACLRDDYLALLREAGFTDIRVLREFDYFASSPSADTRRIAEGLGARAIELTARRPGAAPSRLSRLAARLHPRHLKTAGARGLSGALAALTAVFTCYGLTLLVAVLAGLGLTVNLDAQIWAGAISLMTILAVAGTAFNTTRHGKIAPVVIAAAGGAAILYSMLGSYDPIVEFAGFAALLAAVGADLYLLYRHQLC